jgi:dTDP-glucose 4,6-dehydratase
MIEIVPDRPGHDRRYLLDSGLIRAELGWAPEVEFGPSLASTIDWYAGHREWWKPLCERAVIDERAWTGAA